MTTTPTLIDKTVLVTGANRGLDRALVDEALARGAARIFAAARHPVTRTDARVTRALLPVLTGSRGSIVNVLSLAALAPVPITQAYSISKAAAFSMSQSLRALLAGQGVAVYVALPGPIDTDMIRDWDIPKTAAPDVAAAIFDGVANGDEEIFPDVWSAALAPSWRDGTIKTLERQNAQAVQSVAVPS